MEGQLLHFMEEIEDTGSLISYHKNIIKVQNTVRKEEELQEEELQAWPSLIFLDQGVRSPQQQKAKALCPTHNKLLREHLISYFLLFCILLLIIMLLSFP